MIRPLFLTLLSTHLLSGVPAAPQKQKVPPPILAVGPAPHASAPSASSRMLLQWIPGPVTCDGATVTGMSTTSNS